MKNTTINFEILMHYFAQSEAAALAVLCAHVRKNIAELPSSPDKESTDIEVKGWLQDIEAAAVESIQRNDGNVVTWIQEVSESMQKVIS